MTNDYTVSLSLALYARIAPPASSAAIIGIFYLHLFTAYNLVDWLGGSLEKMPPIYFWLLHAHYVELPASSFSSPAGYSATSSPQVRTN